MENELNIITTIRSWYAGILNSISEEELNRIPDGFNNNIAWNMAHVVVTQQIICYEFGGLKPVLDPELIQTYRRGTKPEKAITKAEMAEILQKGDEMLIRLQKDIKNGVFEQYHSDESRFGIPVNSIEAAVSILVPHESVHFGYVMALRKALG